MREEQGRHVVFYVPRPYGVRVVRVLHERMLPNRHDLNDDE
jgi:plasmid stabilization system protein ParE